MELLNTYSTFIVFVIVILSWLVTVIVILKTWHKLRYEFLQAGLKWPYPEQSDINATFRSNIVKGYALMFKGIKDILFLLLAKNNYNVVIQNHIRKLRRVFVIFFALPFLFIFALFIIFIALTI